MRRLPWEGVSQNGRGSRSDCGAGHELLLLGWESEPSDDRTRPRSSGRSLALAKLSSWEGSRLRLGLTRFGLLALCLMLVMLTKAPAKPPAPGMHMTFDEEFRSFDWAPDGGHRWMTRYPYTGRSARTLTPNEQEYYSDASVGVHPFSLHDGALDITAGPGPNRRGLPYNSGVITTYKSFSQLYGYFEMRARLPAGPGLWPAFWLLPSNLSWPPELDIVEMLGKDPGTLYFSTHTKVSGHDSGHTIPVKVGDVSTSFHTYGVDWEPDTITWYFDGRAVAHQPTPPDMHKPMFILVNLGIGKEGSWPGAPDERTPFPVHMLVKWIRAYSRDKS